MNEGNRIVAKSAGREKIIDDRIPSYLASGSHVVFTVNLAERRGNRLLVERIDVLRTAFRNVRARHPFHTEAIVILPDHLHCVWTLGPGDTDCSTRWSLIKGHFSRAIEKGERISQSRAKRGERGLWQRRFWEHLIRDQADFNRHRGLRPLEPGKTDAYPIGLIPVSMRSDGEESIRKIGVARTSQVLSDGQLEHDGAIYAVR